MASSTAGLGLGPSLGLGWSWRRAQRAGLGCRAWLGWLAGRRLLKAEANRGLWRAVAGFIKRVEVPQTPTETATVLLSVTNKEKPQNPYPPPRSKPREPPPTVSMFRCLHSCCMQASFSDERGRVRTGNPTHHSQTEANRGAPQTPLL